MKKIIYIFLVVFTFSSCANEFAKTDREFNKAVKELNEFEAFLIQQEAQ